MASRLHPLRPARSRPRRCSLLPAAAATAASSSRRPARVPSILRDAGDLHRFRGTGRDLTDSVLEGRITGMDGSCTRDGPTTTVATVSVGIELTRGPAAPGRTTDMAYFVAVSEGDQILDKQVYTLHAEFPANTDRLRLAGDRSSCACR